MNQPHEVIRMLATDVASKIIRGESSKIADRLMALPARQTCVSAVTRSELMYGLNQFHEYEHAILPVQEFLKIVHTLSWDAAAADRYATLRHELVQRGVNAGEKDIEIAAHSLAIGAVLVTTNFSSFANISASLALENWSDS